MSGDAKILSATDTTPDPVDDVVADDDDVVVLSWWQHPVNVVALVVASLLIGGMVGWMIGRAGDDLADDEVSTGFLQDMRAHHDQAVVMGLLYLDVPDTDPGLTAVARTIVTGQSLETGRMVQLLRDAGAAEAGPEDEAMAWMGMPTTVAAMPGMATEEELLALGNASGAEADERFAELMIAHHEGGIHMAEYAAEHAGSDEVRRMAAAMAEGQRSEIAEIEGLIG